MIMRLHIILLFSLLLLIVSLEITSSYGNEVTGRPLGVVLKTLRPWRGNIRTTTAPPERSRSALAVIEAEDSVGSAINSPKKKSRKPSHVRPSESSGESNSSSSGTFGVHRDASGSSTQRPPTSTRVPFGQEPQGSDSGATLSSSTPVIRTSPPSSFSESPPRQPLSSTRKPTIRLDSGHGGNAAAKLPPHSTTTVHPPGLGGPKRNRPANNKHVRVTTEKSTAHALDTEKCGGNVSVSSIPKVIRSPGWGTVKYPAHADCTWLLKTNWDPDEGIPMVRIKILQLELEDDIDCKYDYLDIRGHNRKLCGVIKDKQIVINATELALHFKTDSNYEGKGFEVEVSIDIEGCLPKIYVKDGVEGGHLNSPMFPQPYPDGIDCWTQISAADRVSKDRENATISLSFEFIELEPDDKCAYDYIELFDGYVEDTKTPGKSLGRFCEFNVRHDHAEELKGSNGHSSYGLEGHPDARGVARTIAGSPVPPAAASLSVRSTGSVILVHFHSDQLLSSRGYKASYSVDTLQRSRGDNCDWSVDERAFTINSPNYPQKYPSNSDCTVTLKAPTPEHRIAVIFESFHLEIDANCSFDRLEIFEDSPSTGQDGSGVMMVPTSHGRISDGSTGSVDPRLPLSEPAKVLCGRKSAKFKFLSKGSQIKLRFVSDNFAEEPGFAARYTFIKDSTVYPSPSAHDSVGSRFEKSFERVPQNATVLSGSSHLLNCMPKLPEGLDGSSTEAAAADTISVTWIKDDKVITEGAYEGGTKLLIREFSPTSVGRYICKYGGFSREAWLNIKSSPCSPVFRKRPRDLVLSEGEYAILECNAVTTPLGKVSIQWFKDGKRIGEEQNKSNNSTKIEQLQNGYLILNGIQREDSGFYFCKATVDGQGPGCELSAAAKLTVNMRINVDMICGRPILGTPSKQKPSVDDYGKIVGGQDAQRGAFPWQVMFWDYKRRSFCGGALLNERWVITAAHCFETPRDSSDTTAQSAPHVEVRLGRYDQSLVSEENQLVTKIAEVIKHPDFNKETFDNDLALVKLEDHIHFDNYVMPVCLGKTKEDTELVFFKHHVLKMGHVTGWGQLKENGPQPKFLQELRMPIVPLASCRESTQFKVTPNMFCAGYAQEIVGDACKGDSGGPFVGSQDDRWYLLGVVSWGEGCGRSGKYGFYTKANNYIEWIRAFIKL